MKIVTDLNFENSILKTADKLASKWTNNQNQSADLLLYLVLTN